MTLENLRQIGQLPLDDKMKKLAKHADDVVQLSLYHKKKVLADTLNISQATFSTLFPMLLALTELGVPSKLKQDY